MSILSLEFAIFISVVLLIYYVIPQKRRWIVLLIGSYGFYAAANWKCVFLILFTTVQTYLAAQLLGKMNQKIKELKKNIDDKEKRKVIKKQLADKKKWVVAFTLLFNFALLFFFKTSYLWKEVPLLLPLGISFYTFQTVGYLIDVYRAEADAETNIFKYALFVSYFPQIIQGPVNRYKQLAPQLYGGTRFDLRNIKMGFWLFLWGLLKKLVIAERAAIFVRTVLGSDLTQTPGSIVLLGIFVFNVELYTDFSGGIDMVQGISTMFGIEMAENFRRPFFSRSLGEYWRRWHISLGGWIKDYVFYPLAISKTFGKMGKLVEKRVNVHVGRCLPGAAASLITFILIGLWHDVTIQYLLYGLWHGLIMGGAVIAAPLLKQITGKLQLETETLSYRWFQRARTWMLITIGEYCSVAASMSALMLMIKRTLFHFKPSALVVSLWDYSLSAKDWNVLIAAVLFLICVSMKQEQGVKIREALERQNAVFRWLVVTLAILIIIIFGEYSTGYSASNFIYGGF